MKYDKAEIEALMQKVLADIGPDRFATLRLMELEQVVRASDPNQRLPGKTLLREAIHKFRMARWPGTAPKKFTGRN